MEKIIINKLGPINHCEMEVNDFMVFTGPQASGKSTIAKSIFLFKNIKRLIQVQINKFFSEENSQQRMPIRNRLIKEIRAIFLQTFGSTWCMDKEMSMLYCYTDNIQINICLKDDPETPNYIWIDLCKELKEFLNVCEKDRNLEEETSADEIKRKIDEFFDNDEDVIYIPAGRNMMTLFSSQLMYMYSLMEDEQKRSMDYCTRHYLEQIMRLKSFFSDNVQTKMVLSKYAIKEGRTKENLQQCAELMKTILDGEYRNVNGEERMQMAGERYVKINFASSGQQEAVWILNVLFYYLLNKKKAFFIIEEPESHLFPHAQKEITEYISLAKNGGNGVLLTTHSPYILGTINNLLYANKIAKAVDKSKLEAIVNHLKWIDFKFFSAYFVEDGVVEECLDREFEAINNEIIDGASDKINNDYEAMVELRHAYGAEG